MRPFLLLVLVGAVSAPAAGQIQRAAPAFQAAVSPWFGITSFATRHSSYELQAKYRASLTFGVRGELPLTRRVGVLGSLAVSPLSKQRVENPVTKSLHDGVIIIRADVALGWRFVPRAPVFFFGGGGIMRASLPAYPGFDQSVTEPRGVFGLGYDHPSSGRWRFRVTAAAYGSRPEDPDPAAWAEPGPIHAVETKSMVFDWGLEIGGRYRIGS